VLPSSFLDSLNGIKGFNKDSFVQVHESNEQVTSVRFNPLKLSRLTSDLPIHNLPAGQAGSQLTPHSPVPWSSHGYYLPERPAFIFDPLLHAGVYYVQEASGMFLEQALKQTIDVSQPLNVLDLCAAPGGKSTLLQSIINEHSLLVSNEVIKSRVTILEENTTKWGGPNVIVTNNDPKDFARLEDFFDAIVVDAPCSGSGLFRREPDAIQEWSEQNVQLCHQRQQRILADVYPALKQNGVLIYCTCSYSKEEDEEILDWLLEQFAMDSEQLSVDDSWGIVEVRSARHKAVGYRFFPDKLKGEGFFIACLRKKDGADTLPRLPKNPALQKVSKKESALILPWLKQQSPLQLWKLNDWIMAVPGAVEKQLLTVTDKLYIRQAGINIGKMAGDELIPHHALAVSTIVSDHIVGITLKKEEALHYLRKEDVKAATMQRGWTLVQFEQWNLGWIKVLPNRINNYYPKEWRILKSTN
jgi:16S rRNA C967 or C1407 C5-methylase (RsmB/RsmF family)/NOL1/NOP2/fmu family ribosome biogenesis protein